MPAFTWAPSPPCDGTVTLSTRTPCVPLLSAAYPGDSTGDHQDDQKLLNARCASLGDQLVIDYSGDLFYHAVCPRTTPRTMALLRAAFVFSRCGYLGIGADMKSRELRLPHETGRPDGGP